MSRHQPRLQLRLAATPAELRAALALRYRVFVDELGAAGPGVDHAGRLESDRFDPHCVHLLLVDALHGGRVVGATRLMDAEGAARAGGFATEAEFDIAPLRASGLRLLELGRTCLHPDYRGGPGLHRLWQGIAAVVRRRGIGLLFGLASLPGADPAAHAAALGALHRDHLAPPALRARSLAPASWAPAPPCADARAAVEALPALVKAYLRVGGRIGEGAFADRAFGCTDVCMVLDLRDLGPFGRGLLARAGD